MIQCRECGKRKKVQRLPGNRTAWRCSACRKPKTPAVKTEVRCYICAGSVFLRASKIEQSDYYVCGPCCKSGKDRLLRNLMPPGHIIVHKYNAAAGFKGFDIREPRDEEWLSVQRAKQILELGLQQNREERGDD